MKRQQSALYWYTNLQLSEALARKFNLNRVAAIKRCARRMRDAVKYDDLFNFAQLILKSNDASIDHVTKMLESDK